MRLRGDRYKLIEKEVIKMFSKLKIKSFPLDCFDICDQLGFLLVPYSKLSEKKRKALKIGIQDGCHALWEATVTSLVQTHDLTTWGIEKFQSRPIWQAMNYAISPTFSLTVSQKGAIIRLEKGAWFRWLKLFLHHMMWCSKRCL